EDGAGPLRMADHRPTIDSAAAPWKGRAFDPEISNTLVCDRHAGLCCARLGRDRLLRPLWQSLCRTRRSAGAATSAGSVSRLSPRSSRARAAARDRPWQRVAGPLRADARAADGLAERELSRGRRASLARAHPRLPRHLAAAALGCRARVV